MKEQITSQFTDSDLQKIAAYLSMQPSVQEQNDDEIVIDLRELFRALQKKLWAILLAGVVFAGCFLTGTVAFVHPKYTAQTLLYVNSSNISLGGAKVSISASELTAAKSLVDTYVVILKTRTTLNEVIEQSGLDLTYGEVSNMIEAQSVNGTEVFAIKVTSTVPEEAELLANTIGVVLSNKIASIVEGSSARIVDYAVVPSQKSSPSLKNNTIIGFAVGSFLTAALVLIQMLRDDKIRDTNYLKQKYSTPILAVVPDLTFSGGKNYSKYASGKREKHRHIPRKALSADECIQYIGENLNFASAEAYKLLRTNLSFSLPVDTGKCRVIGVTSSIAGEAKSTTAINLAYTLAQNNQKVLFLEADMRLPVAAKWLHLKQTPGLSNLLAGQCNGNEVIQKSGLISEFRVCTAGSIPPNPSELLGSDRMKTTVDVFKDYFDVIIIDLPPVNVVTDALLLNEVVDGMIHVVREGYCNKTALAEAVSQQRFAGTKVLGFVLTDANIQEKGYYKKYYGR